MTLRERLLATVLSGDRGLGLVTVMTVMAVISALAITATTLSIKNLDNSRRDRQALAALATGEAGVSQALSFLRTGNLSALTCMEPATGASPTGTCLSTTESWTSSVAPKQVRVDGTAGPCVDSTDCYRVWIGTLQPYTPSCPGRHATPPRPCSGTYRVHATGVSGNGPGARALAVDVQVTPYPYPMGVFAEVFSGNGNVGIHRQSLFTLGCMVNRQRDDVSGSGTQFEWDPGAGRPVLDLFYDHPAAAHATAQISTDNNSCASAPIHTASDCDPLYRFDRSGQGGPLTAGDGCYGAYVRTDGSGTVHPTTSEFTQDELVERYGYRPRGLSDSQYDSLRSQAQGQGTYNIAPGDVYARLTQLAAQGIMSPVLYWDNGDVTLNQRDFPAAFQRTPTTATTCGSQSVTIVVSGPDNDLKYSGGTSAPWLVAAMFVPDGELTGAGGRNTIGTVFAKTLDLGGNVDFFMDQCFASNPPGGTLDVEVVDWREDDGRDLN